MHGQIDGWTFAGIGWMDGWMDGWPFGGIGWMDGWMDGWMAGWLGWMEGCMVDCYSDRASRLSLQRLHPLLPHLIEEPLPLVEVGGNLQAVLQQLLAGWVDVWSKGASRLFFYYP